jgi:hypothetical protein
VFEVAVEMALVAKSQFGRHQAGRNTLFQEDAGSLDPDPDLVRMRGNPELMGEGMHQGEPAQPRQG